MNLIIDVGNTFVKFAVFKENDIVFRLKCNIENFENKYGDVVSEFPKIKEVIISSVGFLDAQHIRRVKNDFEPLLLNSDTNLPFKNMYKTPKTLGVDRLALVSASVKYFAKKNVLIIDAGTCITYDLITNKNNYLGGAISPGIRLRYQSLHNLTANLPLLETKLSKSITGDSTETSIHSGVVIGVVKEIDGVIDEYQEKHQDLTVILTGGDAKFLSNQLKNSIFAHSDFLLEGLNYILEFNSK